MLKRALLVVRAGFLRIPIRGHEALNHRRNQLARFTDRLFRSRGKVFGIGYEIAVNGCRQLHGDFDWLVIFQSAELELRHDGPRMVPGQSRSRYAHRKSRADGESGRDVKVLAHNLLACIIDGPFPTVADGLNEAAVIAGGELGANAQQS